MTFKFALLGISLLSVACEGNLERTINPIGFNQEDTKVLSKSLDQWCERVGECVRIDPSSPNTIHLVLDSDGLDSKNSAGIININDDRLTGEKTAKIHVNLKFKENEENWASYLESVVTHEFGHFLTEDMSHTNDPKGVMYLGYNTANVLLTSDLDWYYGK